MKALFLLLILALPQETDLDKILLEFQQNEAKANTDMEYYKFVDRAILRLEQYIKDNAKAADLPRAYFVLADFLSRRNDLEFAVKKFDEFVAKFPDDKGVPQARFAAADLQLRQEKDEDAGRRLEEFIKLYPKDDRVLIAKIYQGLLLLYAKKFDEAADFLNRVREEFKDRKESWQAVQLVATCRHLQEKPEECRTILEKIIKECPQQEIVQVARRLLGEYSLLGRDAPSFTETDVAGGEFSVNRYKGSVIVLYFFSARLPFAEAEHAFLKDAYTRLEKKGLVIMGVGVDPDRRDFEQFRDGKRIAWPLCYDGKNLDGKLARICSVTGLPSLTVIDRKGKTRFFNISGRDLRIAVEKLLDEK